MAAISAVDIALWDILGKSAKQPVYRLLGGRTKPRIPVYASRLYSVELSELAVEARRYKDEGYQAMKLRFGWGPTDGAAGMQRNLALVRTVREAVGDDVDVLDSRLRQANASPARTVSSTLARGTGHS
jgi:L-alanine-DL-glutamate epimerase-like enolase superfamily enzyme